MNTKHKSLIDAGTTVEPKLWRDTEGMLEEVHTIDQDTYVVRSSGYTRPGSIACHLHDTGNGFNVIFPAYQCDEAVECITLDYQQARNLALALSRHAKDLGFNQQ